MAREIAGSLARRVEFGDEVVRNSGLRLDLVAPRPRWRFFSQKTSAAVSGG
jgi:hypothetical protein